MLEILDRQKIEKLKEQIRVDMSKLISEECELPFEFFEQKKVKRGVYKIETPVFEFDGKFYPQNMFWSYGVYDDSIVAFIHGDFPKLGSLFRTINDEWLPGIKAEKNRGNFLESYAELIEFELDLKNNQYKVVIENAETKTEEKTEKQKGE